MKIDRIPNDYSIVEFLSRYYEPRRPVVVVDAAPGWPKPDEWEPAALRDRLEQSPEVRRGPIWWESTAAFLSTHEPRPRIFEDLQEARGYEDRDYPYRWWISGPSTPTHWHYDGNALDVFNIQLRGQKTFRLLSPDTPPAMYAFGRTSPWAYHQIAEFPGQGYRYFEITLDEGEMVFIPRHWWHSVTSTGDINVNINYVWTDLKSGPRHCETGRRDRELVRLFDLYYQSSDAIKRHSKNAESVLAKAEDYLRFYLSSPTYVSGFGGGHDHSVTKTYTRDVDVRALGTRLVRELAALLKYRRPHQALFDGGIERNQGVPRSIDDYFVKAERREKR